MFYKLAWKSGVKKWSVYTSERRRISLFLIQQQRLRKRILLLLSVRHKWNPKPRKHPKKPQKKEIYRARCVESPTHIWEVYATITNNSITDVKTVVIAAA